MKLFKEDLSWSASQGIIFEDQVEKLWTNLDVRAQSRSQFDVVHLLYYLGAMLVISAMGWFMNKSWEEFGGRGIFLIASAYGLAFALAGCFLWFKTTSKTAGGILVTLAVWMAPLAIYGLQRWLGLWPTEDPGDYAEFHAFVNSGWLYMEIGTILLGVIALIFVRFPFLTFPIAFALWYMSMDLTPYFYKQSEYFSWHDRFTVSLYFGLIMIVVSYILDHRTKQDYSFWGYLFGLMAFWGGMTLLESGSEKMKVIYCVVNVVLMLLAIFLDRKAFMVFGAWGVFAYLGHLAYEVYRDSSTFPFVLSAVGVVLILVGVLYHRRQASIDQSLISLVPKWLQALRPSRRDSRI